MKIEILGVRKKPLWKFWRIDNLEVDVSVDGKQKTITLFQYYFIRANFEEYIKNKVKYGRQWIDYKKIKEIEDEKNTLMETQKMVGQIIEV